MVVVDVRLPEIPLMPGDQIRVEVPGGRQLDIQVPEGVGPGGIVKVSYPRNASTPPPPDGNLKGTAPPCGDRLGATPPPYNNHFNGEALREKDCSKDSNNQME